MNKNELLTRIHTQALDAIAETLITLQDESVAIGEIPRRFEQWDDSHGTVLWWETSLTSGEITEPPEHIGSPVSSDWPYDIDNEPHLLWVPLPKLARGTP
jgi:hypothetical protein